MHDDVTVMAPKLSFYAANHSRILFQTEQVYIVNPLHGATAGIRIVHSMIWLALTGD